MNAKLNRSRERLDTIRENAKLIRSREQLNILRELMKPLGDRVLVKRAQTEETSKGGIVLPSSAQQGKNTGTVVAVGTRGHLVEKELLKPGDHILFLPDRGLPVNVNGEDCLILSEDEIVAVEN